MRRFFLLLISYCLYCLVANSQDKTQLELSPDTICTGQNFITGDSIIALEYSLPQAIYDYQVDSVDHHLTLLLRELSKNEQRYKKRGYIIEYDMLDEKILWEKELNYRKETAGLSDGLILYAGKGLPFVLNKQNGTRKWIVKNHLIFKDQVKKIGLGYEIHTTKQSVNMLEGIDLIDGTTIWRRHIDRKFGWNDLAFLDDSTMVVAACGLHAINLFTGKGWDYEMETGDENYTKSAVVSALGVASGLLTGTYFIRTGPDIVHQLSSNILIDSLYLYIASLEKIAKLDKRGNLLWDNFLPEKLTGASKLHLAENNLIMINMGYAKKENRIIKFGSPYIASYNSKTGNLNYRKDVHSFGKQILTAYRITEFYVILIFDDKIEKYDLHSGELLQEKKFDHLKHGRINNFINGNIWHKRENNEFLRFSEIGQKQHYLLTEEDKIVEMNSSLEVQNEMSTDSLYILNSVYENLKFLTNEEGTIALDKSNKKLAKLPDIIRIRILGNKLLIFRKDSFLIIDMEEFSPGFL